MDNNRSMREFPSEDDCYQGCQKEVLTSTHRNREKHSSLKDKQDDIDMNTEGKIDEVKVANTDKIPAKENENLG